MGLCSTLLILGEFLLVVFASIRLSLKVNRGLSITAAILNATEFSHRALYIRHNPCNNSPYLLSLRHIQVYFQAITYQI